jgi:hypothetical protein
VPKDDYAKARRGDIARRTTAQQGFEQRERQRDNAKQRRKAARLQRPIESLLHPKEKEIAAASKRVDRGGKFYDDDILARLELAAMGSGNAFYDALVMMRRKMA